MSNRKRAFYIGMALFLVILACIDTGSPRLDRALWFEAGLFALVAIAPWRFE